MHGGRGRRYYPDQVLTTLFCRLDDGVAFTTPGMDQGEEACN